MCIIDTTSKVRHKINIKFEEKSIFSLELLIETLVPQERKCADFDNSIAAERSVEQKLPLLLVAKYRN